MGPSQWTLALHSSTRTRTPTYYQKNKSFLSNLIAEEGNTRDIARFSSLGLPHSGSWLSVVPSTPLGLHLRPAEFIPILKYRLGIPVYSSRGTCPACGAAH